MAIKVDRDGNIISKRGNFKQENKRSQESRDFYLYFIKADNYLNYWVTSESNHKIRMAVRVKKQGLQDAVVEFVGKFTCTKKEMREIKNKFIKENLLDAGLKARWQKR